MSPPSLEPEPPEEGWEPEPPPDLALPILLLMDDEDEGEEDEDEELDVPNLEGAVEVLGVEAAEDTEGE